jgi:hypothetical protein
MIMVTSETKSPTELRTKPLRRAPLGSVSLFGRGAVVSSERSRRSEIPAVSSGLPPENSTEMR